MRTALGNRVSGPSVRRLVCGLLAVATLFVCRPAAADKRGDDDDRSERSGQSERSKWSERSRNSAKSSERSKSMERMKAYQKSKSGSGSSGGLPTFDEIAEYVESTLESKKDYQKGDLITQSDVANIIAQLEKAGLPVRQKQEGFDPVLPDSHRLVAILRTKEGVKFVRDLDNSDVLDRMARLVEFPEGLDLVQKLVASGDVKTAALLDNQDICGQLEAKYFGNPSMENFAVLSGKAYDSDQLLDHLQLIYDLTVNNVSRPIE